MQRGDWLEAKIRRLNRLQEKRPTFLRSKVIKKLRLQLMHLRMDAILGSEERDKRN